MLENSRNNIDITHKKTVERFMPAPGIITFLFIAAILLAHPLTAAEQGSAGWAGAFLRTGVGSRALGMGGAFSAMPGDSTSIYWNPAGATYLDRTELSFMHGNLSLDRKYHYISLARPVDDGKYYLGFGYLREAIDGIENRDNAGTLISLFNNTDTAYYLSGAWKVYDRLSLGVNAKYISKDLFTANADGLGLDFGMLYHATPKLNLAITFTNIFAKLQWENTNTNPEEKIPEAATLGLSYQLLKATTLAVDIKKTKQFDAQFFAGIESVFLNKIALRAGSMDGDLTIGVGVKHKNIDFNYAYVDEEFAGASHRISSSFRFGEGIPSKAKKPGRPAQAQVLKKDFHDEVNQGISLFREENFEQSLNIFKKILEQDKTNADALYYTGNCLVSLNKKELAQKYYAKALEVDPNHKFSMYAKLYLNK